MVRLGAGGFIASIIELFKFQFQYGTIGGSDCQPPSPIPTPFQFQYGTIGGQLTRLLADAAELFQFQYGTIGGRISITSSAFFIVISIPVWYDWGTIPSYQIIKVNIISIPVWYDWGFHYIFLELLHHLFQFQYGTIGGVTDMV